MRKEQPTCPACGETGGEYGDCRCNLASTVECGTCGSPGAFAEILAAFVHTGDPMVYGECDFFDAEHLRVPNYAAA